MLNSAFTDWTHSSKRFFIKTPIFATIMAGLLLSGCAVNPATGDRQFTALLPAGKEAAVGADEHKKIEAQYGGFMSGPIATYVNKVGQRVAANTERTDVTYKFSVIDSPIVNAFALPGGYIYVSRGLLALANSEAELAGVLGHEVGHVTGRHAAERMSQGFVVGLGAAVLGAASGSSGVAQAANVGSNLYISSYSRGQEHQSDELGVRYLSRAGYYPFAMSDFLASLDRQSKLAQKESGQKAGFNYFSTHPITSERVSQAAAQAAKYAKGQDMVNRGTYLTKINGLTYGDSADQGFVRGNKFYHTKLGFMFEMPAGSKITNGASQVVTTNPNGSVVIFDMAKGQGSATSYLANGWLKGKATNGVDSIKINGMPAATTIVSGNIQGKAMNIRLVAVEWSAGQFMRFQMAVPQSLGNRFDNELKKATYSLRRLSASEKNSLQPKKLRVLEAPSGSTMQSMANRMNVDGNKLEHFMVLNALKSSDLIIAGQPYKIVM